MAILMGRIAGTFLAERQEQCNLHFSKTVEPITGRTAHRGEESLRKPEKNLGKTESLLP